jgi:GAF domain-containing protein
LVTRVIEDAKPVVISNVQTEENELTDTLKIQRIQSVMCMPLLSGSQSLGAMYFDSVGRRYEFTWEDVSFFEELSRRIAVGIERARFSSDLTTTAEKFSLHT